MVPITTRDGKHVARRDQPGILWIKGQPVTQGEQLFQLTDPERMPHRAQWSHPLCPGSQAVCIVGIVHMGVDEAR